MFNGHFVLMGALTYRSGGCEKAHAINATPIYWMLIIVSVLLWYIVFLVLYKALLMSAKNIAQDHNTADRQRFEVVSVGKLFEYEFDASLTYSTSEKSNPTVIIGDLIGYGLCFLRYGVLRRYTYNGPICSEFVHNLLMTLMLAKGLMYIGSIIILDRTIKKESFNIDNDVM